MKLSIVMMAFNQGNFIAEAIDSVLNQNLPFEWELLIADDSSTDQTKIIVQSYVKKYKNIKYHINKTNIGLHKNYVSTIKRTKGEYIALLEADDYWIDSNKCLLQIKLMDEHPKVLWTFTNGEIVDSQGNVIEKRDKVYPKFTNLDGFVGSFFNPLNNTVIFRKKSEPLRYPDYFFKVRQWDTVLHYLRLISDENGEGLVGYIPLSGLAWRRHEGATSFKLFSGTKRYFDWITINREMKIVMPKRLKKHFNKDYVAYEYICLSYWKERNVLLTLKYFVLMILCKPIRPLSEFRDFFWKFRNRTIS